MRNHRGRVGSRASAIAAAMAIALLSALLAPVGARADLGTVRVVLGAEVRQGANTVALTEDGQIGFVAAYGRPDAGGQAVNEVYSFNTATGAVIDRRGLSGFFPRQVTYCESNGYVAVRHMGSTYDDQGVLVGSAWIDVLTTDTGKGTGGEEGSFKMSYSLEVWER